MTPFESHLLCANNEMKEKNYKNKQYLHILEFVSLARVGVSRHVTF